MGSYIKGTFKKEFLKVLFILFSYALIILKITYVTNMLKNKKIVEYVEKGKKIKYN